MLFSQEVLDSGYSHEVEECRASEWFRCMEVGWWWARLVHRHIFPNESAIRPGTRLLCVLYQLFTSVYGCGSATAGRWFQRGLQSLEDVARCTDLTLTDTQRLGR